MKKLKLYKSTWKVGQVFKIVEIVQGKRALAESVRTQGFWLGGAPVRFAICVKKNR